MSEVNEGVYFGCPYCGEEISMSFEIYSGGQEYIEDCEVCCRPIQVGYQVEDGRINLTFVRRLDD